MLLTSFSLKIKKNMFSSVFSRFSACRSALVKLLSGREADCIAEATLLLMLSLVDSDSSSDQNPVFRVQRQMLFCL